MLDYAKVLQALRELPVDDAFLSSKETFDAFELWRLLCSQQQFQEILSANAVELAIPCFKQDISEYYHVLPYQFCHEVIGIDGSQIYPDRHLGLFCSLVNIGIVQFSYGYKYGFRHSSDPYIFMNYNELEMYNPIELTNAKRHEMELNSALTLLTDPEVQQRLYVFDGSMIFWHLVSKEQRYFDNFFPQSIELLEQFHQKKMLTAWYISKPKSKELVSLLNTAHTLFPEHFTLEFKRIRDENIMRLFLKPEQRTVVYCSNVAIAMKYPKSLQPHFVYYNTGQEIARIEFPAWIAQDENLVNQIMTMVSSQITKGFGYPIALAEAHEQAVVKSADRDLFFHLISKWSKEHNTNISITQKNSKKRRMSV